MSAMGHSSSPLVFPSPRISVMNLQMVLDYDRAFLSSLFIPSLSTSIRATVTNT